MNTTEVMLQEANKYKESGDWIAYNEIMLIRNDRLLEPEKEIYLITTGEYSEYSIVAILEGIRGLEIDKIQIIFYKFIIKEYGVTFNQKDWLYNIIRFVYEKYNLSLEQVFINYLVEKFRLKILDVKETNFSLISIVRVAKDA